MTPLTRVGQKAESKVAYARSGPGGGDVLLSWVDHYSDCAQGVQIFCSWETDPSWGRRVVDHDTSISRITVSVSNTPADTSLVESCLSVSRDSDPLYPMTTAGYSELLCWHATRFSRRADWSVDLDLTRTPLFFPGGSTLSCGGNLEGTTLANASTTQFRCDITGKAYKHGDPRYRLLRLPYNDQGPEADGSLAHSVYQGSDAMPLHVVGMHLFQSFGGQNVDATLTAPCLQWLDAQGAVRQDACFSDQTYQSTANYDSPAGLLSVDWVVEAPEAITAVGQQSRLNTDAAFYVLAEIPPTVKATTENIVRDYDNLDQTFLEQFATGNVQWLTHPVYCGGQPSCSDQTKITNFLLLFKGASCLSTRQGC